MKIRLVVLILISLSLLNAAVAGGTNFIQTKEGIIVYTDPAYTGRAAAVKLQEIADNIIRVVAAPGKGIKSSESLITVYSEKTAIFRNVISTKETVTLKTKSLQAIVSLKTGAVIFKDNNGKIILEEKQAAGRNFKPALFDGKPYYALTQAFQSTPDDAWYGLGQHQDGIINYRGQQVTFFQNNTEVAVPFLISSKIYGILWDNYSLTTAGAARPLHPLSSLQLFAKTGEEGWLTASYCNNKSNSGDVITQRAEICYQHGIPQQFQNRSAKRI